MYTHTRAGKKSQGRKRIECIYPPPMLSCSSSSTCVSIPWDWGRCPVVGMYRWWTRSCCWWWTGSRRRRSRRGTDADCSTRRARSAPWRRGWSWRACRPRGRRARSPRLGDSWRRRAGSAGWTVPKLRYATILIKTAHGSGISPTVSPPRASCEASERARCLRAYMWCV